MDKKDLISFCRYYHGEETCPFSEEDKSMLWDYERTWVADMMSDDDFSEYISDYLAVGLRDFSMFDDTPITLKAMLFNRYAKTAYTMQDAVPGFKEFYQKYY